MRLAFGGFYGETGKRLSIAGLGLSEINYAPDVELPKHSHNVPYFCLVLRGSYQETVGREQRFCAPATLLFHPSGESHRNHFGSAGGRCFNLEFTPSWLERLKSAPLRLCEPALWKGGEISALAARAWRDFRLRDDLTSLAIEGLALEMVVSLSRRAQGVSANRPPWLKDVEEFIRDGFDQPLSLDEIATAVNRHPVHVAREFRRHLGSTIGAHIRRLRIEKACASLRTSKERSP